MAKLSLIFFATIFLSISVNASFSQSVKSEALKAFSEKRYRQAVEMLLPFADGNDYELVGTLGAAYFHIDERSDDVSRAVPYLERAAQQGDGRALHYLGVIASDHYLSQSLGRSQDFAASLALFQEAAKQGHASSAATLIGAHLDLRPPSGWLPGRFAPDPQEASRYAGILAQLTNSDHGAYRWHLQLIGAAEWANGNTRSAINYLQKSNDPRALHDVAAIYHRTALGDWGYERILEMYESALAQNYEDSGMRLPANELFAAAHLNMFELYFQAGRHENALMCLVKTFPLPTRLPYFSEEYLAERFAGAFKRLTLRLNVEQLMGSEPKSGSEMSEIVLRAEACRMELPRFWERYLRNSLQLGAQIYRKSNTSSEPVFLFLPARQS